MRIAICEKSLKKRTILAKFLRFVLKDSDSEIYSFCNLDLFEKTLMTIKFDVVFINRTLGQKMELYLRQRLYSSKIIYTITKKNGNHSDFLVDYAEFPHFLELMNPIANKIENLNTSDTIEVEVGGSALKIQCNDVFFARFSGKNCEILTGKNGLISTTTNRAEIFSKLQNESFAYICKGFLVNLLKTVEIQGKFIKMTDGVVISCTKDLGKLKEIYYKYIFESVRKEVE